MKIAFVSTGHPRYDATPHLGGIQQQIRGLAEALVRRGHEAHIIFRECSPDGDDRNAPHFWPVRVPWSDEVVSVLLYSKKATAMLDEIGADVFSLHERFSGFFPSRLRRPKVFVAHNYDAMRFYARFSRSYRAVNWGMFPVKNWIEEECMRRCDVIFALNRRDRDYLQGRHVGRVQQISHGIDPTLYEPGPDDGYILFAGRLNQVKGVEVMERMFERTAAETDFDLHVIGEGPLLPQIEGWRTKTGLQDRVRILGWVSMDRLRDEFSHCSFLILPSLYETLGIVLLEAMASGKPVVASRIPGPEEVVRHGATGFLFTPGSAEDLALYCRRLAEDKALRQELGREGRSDVEKYYTYDAVSSRMMETYERIVNEEAR